MITRPTLQEGALVKYDVRPGLFNVEHGEVLDAEEEIMVLTETTLQMEETQSKYELDGTWEIGEIQFGDIVISQIIKADQRCRQQQGNIYVEKPTEAAASLSKTSKTGSDSGSSVDTTTVSGKLLDTFGKSTVSGKSQCQWRVQRGS